MIKVKIKPEKITISGHARFDDNGNDIVCASVSSIIVTSINAITALETGTIKYKVKKGLAVIDILTKSDITTKLLENMIRILDDLSNDYPKYIKIERE